MSVWIAFATVGFMVVAAVMAQGTLRARRQAVTHVWDPPPIVSRNVLTAMFLTAVAFVLVLLLVDPAYMLIVLLLVLPSWFAYLVRRGLPQVYMWYVTDAMVLGLLAAIILRETAFK